MSKPQVTDERRSWLPLTNLGHLHLNSIAVDDPNKQMQPLASINRHIKAARTQSACLPACLPAC